jgi:hypothetical protein
MQTDRVPGCVNIGEKDHGWIFYHRKPFSWGFVIPHGIPHGSNSQEKIGSLEILKDAMKVRRLIFNRVFHGNGEPIEVSRVREAHKAVSKKDGSENFRFHDFRNTRMNNWRKAGHDCFKIMVPKEGARSPLQGHEV